MLKKTYSKKGSICRVTFDLPLGGNTRKASLCGEFNEWNPRAHPMKKKKGGGFSRTLSLQSGRDYRFKYLLDGKDWENDWSADGYIANSFGSEDSLVKV